MVVHSKFQGNCTSTTFMENCTLATFAIDDPDNTMTDCLMWSMTGLSFTLGNLMLFSLYHYEKFGEDPAKRSLFNRLVSQCLIACSVQTNMGNLLLIISRKVTWFLRKNPKLKVQGSRVNFVWLCHWSSILQI